MQNHKPFGGKLFIIGADFREVLPMVEQGQREDVVEACVRHSVLWPLFTVHCPEVQDGNLCSSNIMTEIFEEVMDPNQTENLCERAILAPKNANFRKFDDEETELPRI
ncbi:hypothetical protein Aduo_011739 [Ancylostoma duodenale]